MMPYGYKLEMDLQTVRLIERDLEDYLSTIKNVDFSSRYNTDIVIGNIMTFHNRLENAYNASQAPKPTPIEKTEIKVSAYENTNGVSYIWHSVDFSKANSLAMVHGKQVYVMEKVNDNYYKVKYGKIVGYMTKKNLEQ